MSTESRGHLVNRLTGPSRGPLWTRRETSPPAIARDGQRLSPKSKGQEEWAHRGVEPVLALLAMGADVGLRDKDGLTALHHAARSDYGPEIAQALPEHGADINTRDGMVRTPLDHAYAARLVRMPELLVGAGGRAGPQ